MNQKTLDRINAAKNAAKLAAELPRIKICENRKEEEFVVPAQLREAIKIINQYSDEVVIKAFRLDIRMSYLISKEVRRFVNKRLGEHQETFCDNNILIILAVCRRVFGAGKKKMEAFMIQYEKMVEDMERYYKADIVSQIEPICKQIVEESGFDLQKFKKRRNVQYRLDDQS